jgi:23S rRNA maturation mini-RNase III
VNEEQVKALIDKYITESRLDERTEELREQVQALEARQGFLNLEQAEERIESLVRHHDVSYAQALDLVVEELEEKEQERQARHAHARREQTQARLEELGEA